MGATILKTKDDSKNLYEGVDQKTLEKYPHIFKLKSPLRARKIKRFFDISFCISAILGLSPLITGILICFLIEALLKKEARGPVLVSYFSLDRGQKFKKLKLRIVKGNLIDYKKLQNGEHGALPGEENDNNLTLVGKFLRKFYLDELPQLLNILKGDISLVGPRALAEEDYNIAINSGHISRFLIQSGIFSRTHVKKNTSTFWSRDAEYSYIDEYMNLGSIRLIVVDLKIIFDGIKMIIKGNGSIDATSIIKK